MSETVCVLAQQGCLTADHLESLRGSFAGGYRHACERWLRELGVLHRAGSGAVFIVDGVRDLPALLDCAQQVAMQFSRVRTLAICSAAEEACDLLVKNGVGGVVGAGESAAVLEEAVRTLGRGWNVLSHAAAVRLPIWEQSSQEDPFLGRLTVRQRQLLGLLAGGASTEQASRMMGITLATGYQHCKGIIRRLRTGSMGGALAQYGRHVLAA